MNEEITKFSDIISGSIERLFKTGGLALVFIFLGFVAMVFGQFYSSTLSSYIFGVGALLSISVLFLFLYVQIRGVNETRKIIRENKELLDATQEITIGLTNTISETQALLFKHAEDVGKILEISVPFLVQFPFLENMNLAETMNVNAVIVATSGRSKEIIDDIHRAFINGDVNELKKYSDDLRNSTDALRKSLSAENKIIKHIPDITVMQENLKVMQENLRVTQESFIKLTDSFSGLLAITIYYKQKADLILSIIPLLSSVKLFGIDQKMNELGVARLQELSGQINHQLSRTRTLVDKLHDALVTGDTQTIASAVKELSDIERFANQLTENNKSGFDPSVRQI